MPRASREQMHTNREAVVRAASTILRAQGSAGITVDAVSAKAGLTRGGFYKQFASRDALISEAFGRAIDERRGVVENIARTAADDPQVALREWYLSTEHRDEAGEGCPVAALAGEVAVNRGGPLDDRFPEALTDLFDATARDGVDRSQVLAEVALMVGALQLARATSGTALSDELLAAARLALDGRQSVKSPKNPVSDSTTAG